MKTNKPAVAKVEPFILGLSNQQARRESDVLRLRLLEILDSVMREKWLPMGLRAFIVQELPALRRHSEKSKPNLSALAAGMRVLADELIGHGRYVLRSETGVRIHALTAELHAQAAA